MGHLGVHGVELGVRSAQEVRPPEGQRRSAIQGSVCFGEMMCATIQGERIWQESRGLKCSKSIAMLGLLQSGKLHRGAVAMMEHDKDAKVVTFSRDGNAALNMRECVARTKRPTRLCRSKSKNRAEQQRVHLIPLCGVKRVAYCMGGRPVGGKYKEARKRLLHAS